MSTEKRKFTERPRLPVSSVLRCEVDEAVGGDCDEAVAEEMTPDPAEFEGTLTIELSFFTAIGSPPAAPVAVLIYKTKAIWVLKMLKQSTQLL